MVNGMAVTVTLIFSDESHREAWLEDEGIISAELPLKNDNGEYILPTQGPERKALLTRVDYERRKGNTDLKFTVGTIYKKVK
jgi:hypothetical protein